MATRNQVLRRHGDVDRAIRGDAEPVRENLGGGKSPTSAAVLLVSDGTHATGILLAAVETNGVSSNPNRTGRPGLFANHGRRDLAVGFRDTYRAKQPRRIGKRDVLEARVAASCPRRSGVGVYRSDGGVVESRGASTGRHDGKGRSKEKYEHVGPQGYHAVKTCFFQGSVVVTTSLVRCVLFPHTNRAQ